MLICPYCNERGILIWKKLLIGPARSINCRICNKKSSVPQSKWIIYLIVIVSLVLGLNTYLNIYVTIFIWFIYMIILGIIILAIPLIKISD
jgi:hypothetical protein